MNLKNILLKSAKAGKLIVPKLIANKTVISEIVFANIHSDLIKKGEIIIPGTLLEKEVQSFMVKNQPDITIDSLTCGEKQINIAITANKFLLSLSSTLTLIIRDAEITKDRQVISFYADPGKMAGNNMLGKLSEKMISLPVMKTIVEAIVKAIINYIFKSVGSQLAITNHIRYSINDSLLIVDLTQIEQIQKLSTPIAGSANSILDFISLKAAHNKDGIIIFAETSDKANLMKNMIGNHLSSILNTVSDGLQTQ